MFRIAGLIAALTAALLLAVAAGAGTSPGPPHTEHATTCNFGSGFTQVTMWLTAGMAAGDTFWIDGRGHYLIQRFSYADTTSDQWPTSGWSEWASIGNKNGRSGSSIECRGVFHDEGTANYHWVDSIDYLIK